MEVVNVIEKDDWRLSGGPLAGNEELIMDATLYYIPFTQFSESWDHEHCSFCWAKFFTDDSSLHEGYCTTPNNERGAHWICPQCYEDFKDMFGWKLAKHTSE